MFKLDDEEALLETFRTRDRKQVELPADLKFPLILRDYVAWVHPAGGRVFLVFAPVDGVPTGIAFDTQGAAAQGPQLCSWCHSHGGGNQVAMLTTTLSNKKRVGVFVCGDLSCKKKLEEACDLAGKNVQAAVKQVVGRMSAFASEGLGIDLAHR